MGFALIPVSDAVMDSGDLIPFAVIDGNFDCVLKINGVGEMKPVLARLRFPEHRIAETLKR